MTVLNISLKHQHLNGLLLSLLMSLYQNESTCEIIGHVRYISILTWPRGFQDKVLYLVVFFYVSKSHLGIARQKKLNKSQSLGSMLEY